MTEVAAEQMERAVAVLPPPGTVVTGSFTKETADAQTGVAIRKQRGKIMITGVLLDSLAANSTDLQAGLQVTSINDTPVEGLSAEEAAKLLVEPEGVITIVAVAPEPPEQSKNTETTSSAKGKFSWCCE